MEINPEVGGDSDMNNVTLLKTVSSLIFAIVSDAEQGGYRTFLVLTLFSPSAR